MSIEKQIVDGRGLPIFGVIEGKDEGGNTVELFKQESMFNREDYCKAAEYQRKLANNHKILADYYTAEFEKLSQKELSKATHKN